MNRVPVRVTAGTGLIGGGLLFAIWSVGGVSITWLSEPMTDLVFSLSYASLAIGFVSVGLLARQTDDAISPAVTALGLGFLLLTPVVLIHLVGQQSLALASIVPFDTIILSVVVGLLAAVCGDAILAGTLVPTHRPQNRGTAMGSTVRRPPRSRNTRLGTQLPTLRINRDHTSRVPGPDNPLHPDRKRCERSCGHRVRHFLPRVLSPRADTAHRLTSASCLRRSPMDLVAGDPLTPVRKDDYWRTAGGNRRQWHG